MRCLLAMHNLDADETRNNLAMLIDSEEDLPVIEQAVNAASAFYSIAPDTIWIDGIEFLRMPRVYRIRPDDPLITDDVSIRVVGDDEFRDEQPVYAEHFRFYPIDYSGGNMFCFRDARYHCAATYVFTIGTLRRILGV